MHAHKSVFAIIGRITREMRYVTPDMDKRRKLNLLEPERYGEREVREPRTHQYTIRRLSLLAPGANVYGKPTMAHLTLVSVTVRTLTVDAAGTEDKF